MFYWGKSANKKRSKSKVPSKVPSKFFSYKLCPKGISISGPLFMNKWFRIKETYVNLYSPSWANTRYGVINFGIDGMVSNIKKWLAQEWNTSFPWNLKIVKLCLKNYIFRSYHFSNHCSHQNTTKSIKKQIPFVLTFRKTLSNKKGHC